MGSHVSTGNLAVVSVLKSAQLFYVEFFLIHFKANPYLFHRVEINLRLLLTQVKNPMDSLKGTIFYQQLSKQRVFELNVYKVRCCKLVVVCRFLIRNNLLVL